MGRIATTFRRLAKTNEAALIPYVQVGYPSVATTRQLLPVIARQGADLIAFGPLHSIFEGESDDASTVTATSEQDSILDECFNVAAEARRSNEVPLLLVSHWEPARNFGPGPLADRCVKSGIDGVIVPDLPLDAADALKTVCSNSGLSLIRTINPYSSDADLTGFDVSIEVFILGLLSSQQRADQAAEWVEQRDERPPLVFAIENAAPEIVAKLSKAADGVMAGALARLIATLPEDDVILEASDFVRTLKEATTRAGMLY